jgi:ABC-type multidrug transport system fused ATPase/permease subunit
MFKRIYNLLNIKQKYKFFIQFILMIIGMIFETMGLGLLLPALSIMSNDKFLAENKIIIYYANKLNLNNQQQIIVSIFLILIIINFIKMIVMTFVVYKQSSFIYNIQAHFSKKLFAGYLNQPYNFHLERNSAQLIKNVIMLISQLTTIMSAILTLLTEFLILTGVTIFLFYIQPLGTLLVISLFVLTTFIFHLSTRNLLKSLGFNFSINEKMRIQHIQQGLGAAKDLKILGREKNFIDKYSFYNTSSSRIGQKQQTLLALPRLVLEFMSVATISILSLYLINSNGNLSTILPMIGLFAAAAIRLMPSVNRIMTSLQAIKYGDSQITELQNEIDIIKQNENINSKTEIFNFKNIIEINNLYFSYNNTDLYVLNGINVNVKFGSTIGFIGTSGAGKTTLIDLILGLHKPSSGQIKVDGNNIYTNLRGWQNQIGYVPQSIFLTDDTLKNNIAFGLDDNDIDEKALNHAIKYAQLESFINDLPEGLSTNVGERGVRISGGQKQRIGIARALYHNPTVLIFDEATSALDNSTEIAFVNAIKNLAGLKTIIIIAHRLTTIEHCDYVYKLDNGKIISEGKYKDVVF